MMEDGGEPIKAVLSKLTSLKKLYLVWRSEPIHVLGESFITRLANEHNDQRKVITHDNQLNCLKQAQFRSPELWLNQLPGVEMEMIFVPMDLWAILSSERRK
jgi:hypothetical protein